MSRFEAANLWVRVGDADSYNDFGQDFEALADYLTLLGVYGPLTRLDRKYAFHSPGFAGMDYISLYWGDEDAQPLREFTRDEVSDLQQRISWRTTV